MASEAGGFNLGNAYGSVIIDVSGVSSAMQQARQAIEGGFSGIGNSISSLGDQMSKLGGAISTFSAPLLAAGGVGLKAAADFDTLLKQIEVFGNVAPEQMSKVSEFALKMGADTKFSSSDAAEALLGLLKAGQSLDEAMQSLPQVLNLAAAGNLSLASASGIVSSALAIFKLKATDAGRVSDALARAANASQADVGDLGQALANVGPIAAMFGLSVEDTSAILGVFANNGIKGAESGTQLKSMLLNLTRPTEDVKGAFERLGVSLYDAQGNSRNFNTVIKELDAALDKLPVEQQNELMQTLGGSYGIVGISALRASGGIDGMLQSMAAAPSAGKIADDFMKTFKGNVESLTGSVETLMVSGLTPFMNEVLTPIVKQITGVVNSMTEWTQKNPELTKQIVKVLAIVAVLGPTLLVAGKAMKSIGEIITVATGSFGLIGLAIAGLVLAFNTNFLGIRDILQPVIDQIGIFFNSILSGMPVGDALGTMFRNLLPPDVVAGITNGFNGIVTFVTETALPALQGFANWFLTEALPAVVNFVGTTVIPGIQKLFTFLSEAWTNISPALQSFANWFLTEALPAVVAFVQNTVIPGIQKLFTFLSEAWNTVSPGLNSLKDWFLTDALPKVKTFVEVDFKNALNSVFGWMATVWTDTIEPGLKKLYDWFMTEGLPKVKTFLEVDFKNALDKVFGWMGTVWEETIKPGITKLYDWFMTEGLPKIKEFVEGDFKTALNNVFGWMGTVWTDTIEPGLNLLKDWFVTGGLQEVVGAVQKFFGEIDKLPAKIQAWIDKQGPLVRLIEDAALAIGLLSGLLIVYNVLAVAAAAVSTAVAAGIGAIRAAVAFLLGPIGLVIIGLTALIALYHEVARLQASYADTQSNGITGINANNISREEYLNRAFASSAAELGDAGARLTWGSTTKGNYQGVGGTAAKFYDENIANGSITVPQRDSGGSGFAMQPYMIGNSQLKNEVYIPGADGQFVSGFVDLMKSVASGVGGGSSGGDTINVMLPEAALANPAAAHAIGQDFGRGILDEMRARGVKGMRG